MLSFHTFTHADPFPGEQDGQNLIN